MKKYLSVFAVFLLLTSPASAVSPRFWHVTTAEDFLAGESEGAAITSRGELRAGAAVRKLASFDDPFVLSQTSDGSGTRYYGTGNSGRVYALKGDQLKVVYTASEPEVYAVAWANGSLLVGTSPHGKVYKVDPAKGTASVFHDPKQPYIWAIEPLASGEVVIGTGVDGKVFVVNRNGEGKLLYDAPEAHIRTISGGPSGRIFAGGSGEGRIYDIALSGSGRALFDSALTEISSISFDPASGVAWAAGVSNFLPTTPPPPKQQEPAKQQQSGQSTQSSGEKKDGSTSAEASTSVEISFGFEESPAASTPAAGSELYRISSDGFVETVRKFEREIIYAVEADSRGALLATGPSGRVYRFENGDVSLTASVPEKQIVSIEQRGENFEITTTNAGAVYALDPKGGGALEYRSAVKDTERFSSFGHYELKGEGLSGVRVSFRSGNSNTPDTTWSDWKVAGGPEGTIAAPAARYVQWKVNADQASAPLRVDSATLAFVNRNVAPVVDSVTVLEPAAVIVSSNYPANPQVLEATNPDEYGIFTGLDSPRDRSDPGKKLYRRGYRTITWKAHDDNNDSLRFDVSFRKKGSAEWLRLRDNIEESQINFDTSQLPDGTYEVRVAASDIPDNPLQPLRSDREGTEFLVDNSAPSISTTRAGDGVTVRITDSLSAIGRVEYSVDAKKWVRLTPADGLADSRDETFRIPAEESRNSFVVIRAVDSFYNVATADANR